LKIEQAETIVIKNVDRDTERSEMIFNRLIAHEFLHNLKSSDGKSLTAQMVEQFESHPPSVCECNDIEVP
jgi:hypothetical protein